MPGGRPAYKPTDKDRTTVRTMAAFGVPEHDIARVVGCTAPTLRKYYFQELATGHVEANAKVAQSLFKKATGEGKESVIAAIFWLKCRAGWRDRPEDVGKKEEVERKAMAAPQGTSWENLLRH